MDCYSPKYGNFIGFDPSPNEYFEQKKRDWSNGNCTLSTTKTVIKHGNESNTPWRCQNRKKLDLEFGPGKWINMGLSENRIPHSISCLIIMLVIKMAIDWRWIPHFRRNPNSAIPFFMASGVAALISNRSTGSSALQFQTGIQYTSFLDELDELQDPRMNMKQQPQNSRKKKLRVPPSKQYAWYSRVSPHSWEGIPDKQVNSHKSV